MVKDFRDADLSSRRPAREVRTHFLVVEEDETDKRFYDPRVLLPASTPLQREELFGEVQSFVVEDRAPLRFTAR